MIKRCKTIILVLFLLVTFIMRIEAAEIKGIRYYSDKEKTRIVIQLSDSTQYKTNYDKDHNLIISILKAEIETTDKSYKINDGLVDSVVLKKAVSGDVIVANVSLIKPATFNVFPLESPSRIVIDASPFENIIKPEVVAISEQDMEIVPTQTQEEKPDTTGTINNAKPQPSIAQPSESSEPNEASSFGVNVPIVRRIFESGSYGIIQLVFDILVLTALVYIAFKMKEAIRIVRLVKKNRKNLKENNVFADMLDELENGHSNQDPENTNIKEQENIEEKIGDDDKDEEKITFPKQYEKIQELAQRGMDPISISEKSDIPVGEVNLILDLIRSRKESQIS